MLGFRGGLGFGGIEEFGEGFGEFLVEGVVSADIDAGDISGTVDDEGVGDAGDAVLASDLAIGVNRNGDVEFEPFEGGGDLFGCFFKVDGDEFDTLIAEFGGDGLDLGEGCAAGAAPTGPEIDEEDFSPAGIELEVRAVEELEVEVGGGFSDEWRGTSGATLGFFAFGGGERFGGGAEFPLLVGESGGGVFDGFTEEQLRDVGEVCGAGAEG